MATANKFNTYIRDTQHGDIAADTDQFIVALTAATPLATNSILANLTEIAYTNLSSRNLTTSTSSQTSGVFTQLFADLVLTASGAVPTFRYVTVYDDTPVSPAKPLCLWFDFGSNLTLASGETLTIAWTTSTYTIT